MYYFDNIEVIAVLFNVFTFVLLQAFWTFSQELSFLSCLRSCEDIYICKYPTFSRVEQYVPRYLYICHPSKVKTLYLSFMTLIVLKNIFLFLLVNFCFNFFVCVFMYHFRICLNFNLAFLLANPFLHFLLCLLCSTISTILITQ